MDESINSFWSQLSAQIEHINPLSEKVYEVILRAPQVTRNFQPGQLFRLNVDSHQPMPVTGAWAENDCITLLITKTSFTTALLEDIFIGKKVGLMGPTGSPSFIPQGKSVLLIADTFGHGPMLAIAYAMKKNNCTTSYIGHDPDHLYINWRARIEAFIDHCSWVNELPDVDSTHYQHILMIGSPLLFKRYKYLSGAHVCTTSPMQCMMKGLCGRCITPVGNDEFIWACDKQDQILN